MESNHLKVIIPEDQVEEKAGQIMIAISLIDEQLLYSVYSLWLTIQKAETEAVLSFGKEDS